ncbi:MAG: hemerythrin domain-containing protein [Acidobacteria bacterium]|nr:hemerythrin domain-containing protein [Acidobacteriota bacterium]
MTHPVELLINEHRLIERVLDELEQRLSGDAFPAEFLEKALDFFIRFADGVHHHKEEQVLFPALAAAGVPVEGGPIGVMLDEHQFGRHCLRMIGANLPAALQGSEESEVQVRQYAAQYLELLRRHIWKEDNVLFQIAQRVLCSSGDVAALEKQFREVPNPLEELVAELTGAGVR